jgi:hypothetical protein
MSRPLIAGLLTLAIAGCGFGAAGSAQASPKGADMPALRGQYLALAKTANDEGSALEADFHTQAGRLDTDPTALTKLEADFIHFADIEHEFIGGLMRMRARVPQSMRAHLLALIKARSDLESLYRQTSTAGSVLAISGSVSDINKALSASRSATDTFRIDLNLPRSGSSPTP